MLFAPLRTLLALVALPACWRGASPPPAPASADDAGVRVTSMPALLAALRPGATIVLAPGDYDIDALPRTPGAHHRWANMFEGDEMPGEEGRDMLVLEGLRDVTIRAERADAPPRLVTGIASATVLVLKDATDVTLRDLALGHSVEGTCGGGVVAVIGGARVRIDGCALSGSGTFGVEAYRTEDLRVSRTRIFHTSEGALRLFDTNGARITDTVIEDNTSLDSFVHVASSPGVVLERVTIRNNRLTNTAVDDQAVFKIHASPGTALRDAQVTGNDAEYFRTGDLATTNVTLSDNRWVRGESAP